MFGRSLLLMGAGLALAACRSAPPEVLPVPEGVEEVPSLLTPSYEYRIGAGDVLRVNVFGHPELSSALLEGAVPGSPVASNGAIMLPLIGEVPVAEASVAEVADRVGERLGRYLKAPRVDVAVVRFGAHRFFVLGEVNEPGSFVLERPTSAMEAIALAGGLGPYANRAQVAWVRGPLQPENLLLIDVSQIDPEAAALVHAGDVIFVGRRRWSSVAVAAKDLLPLVSLVTTPLSLAIQAATLEKID